MKNLNIILLIVTLLSVTMLSAVWMDKFPSQLTQPDGTKLDIFLSGDEFHNWVSDDSGFTIIQDPQTGYWCWAMHSPSSPDVIMSSGYPVHLHSPENLGLQPYINISVQRYQEIRAPRDAEFNSRSHRAPTTGLINNITIFIRFADQEEFTHTTAYYDGIFNDQAPNANSLYRYFYDASYTQLEVISHFYPIPETTILSYQSHHPRNYFMPYNAVTNPDGYTGADHVFRAHNLLADAIIAVRDEIPTDLVLDSNGTGRVDNVVFMVRGQSGAWADLLWPHRWMLFSIDVQIHGKRVWDYNFNMEDYFLNQQFGSTALLVHEFGHSLGAPDFYRYNNNAITPVGIWEVMSNQTNPPQSMSAHVKSKYMDWTTIPTLTAGGTHTLYPNTVNREQHAFRINSHVTDTAYYIVEYRSRLTGITDSTLPGSGLLIYRIIESIDGNAQGPPDEVYVYRPGGTLTTDGNINQAFYSQQSGRTAINQFTNPTPFLLNGVFGGLEIANISSAEETISFLLLNLVSTDPQCLPPRNLSIETMGRDVTITWEAPDWENSILDSSRTPDWEFIGYRVRRFNTDLTPDLITDTIFIDSDLPGATYEYSVNAIYNNGLSISLTDDITVSSAPPNVLLLGPANGSVLNNRRPTLLWRYPLETGFVISGYYVYSSSTNNHPYDPINPDQNRIETIEDHQVRLLYYPEVLPSGTTYYWQVVAFNEFGAGIPSEIWSFTTSGVSDQDKVVEFSALSLHGNHPNPFNPETVIHFSIDCEQLTTNPINISIYNIRGQHIRTLVNDILTMGDNFVSWNGRDDHNREVSSGLYFYRLQTGDITLTQKMILLK
jgi:M6 family metalloprotease-like protein